MRSNSQNYYQILEIPQSATHHDVVAAYQRAREAYSLDSPALYTMFTREEANELRGLIEEAFQILGDQRKRKEYDSTLNKNSTAWTEANQKQAHNPALEKSAMNTATTPAPKDYERNDAFEREIASQTNFDGPFLNRVRQYKKISLEQIVKETRISRTYLKAIEADDFASLPAPVFLRGFVIQFARYLGLNENLVASSYMARIKKDN